MPAKTRYDVYDTYDSVVRLIHPGVDATDVPTFYMNAEIAVITDPTRANSILISREGTSIQGPLAIGATPDQWRVAGLWKVNPMVLTSIPSSIYTPTPWLRASIPRANRAMFEGYAAVAALVGAFLR